MKLIAVWLSFFSAFFAHSQQPERVLTKRIILKTNTLSLLAQKPTISAEKFLNETISFELSFVQGEFNNLLFTDHYDYRGVLARAKKYFTRPDFGMVASYGAIYAGNLRRNIHTAGQTDNSGWFSYPSRDFSANSLRGGGSFGVTWITKSKIIVDGQTSLGYGRYLKINKSDPNTHSNGYLDIQLWLSIGYCF